MQIVRSVRAVLFVVVAILIALFLVAYFVTAVVQTPDSVGVLNDTTETLTLVGCPYSAWIANQVELGPGKRRTIQPTGACEIWRRASYLGCLAIPAEAYEGRVISLSSFNRNVTEERCSNTELREDFPK